MPPILIIISFFKKIVYIPYNVYLFVKTIIVGENMKIVNIKAREVLDSRGFPTVEAEMKLQNGKIYKAIVPSGASVGVRECVELRDNDFSRFLGKGVLKAVDNINGIIRESLIDKDIDEVDSVLLSLDKSENKSLLGVNAMLPISLCAYKYIIENEIKKYTKEPFLMCNIINGGVHSNNKLDIQEFMIIPKGRDILSSLRMASEVFHNLKLILKDNGHSISVGDEGGFAPNLNYTEEALDIIVLAIKKANYVPGKDIFIGLDVAASQFFKENVYHLDGEMLRNVDLINKLVNLVSKYPIMSIEDPFDENDFASFAELTKKIGNKVMIVGDDLFTTNSKYLQKGIELGACNAILIKPNQIGTVKEVEEVVDFARKNSYKIIFSHRSGDTEDSFIANLAAYFESDYVKFGSLSRSERTSKYNELIRIFEK